MQLPEVLSTKFKHRPLSLRVLSEQALIVGYLYREVKTLG